MRLSPSQITIIRKAVADIFGEGSRVMLFGSRADDNKRGGDIDLYIETSEKASLLDKKVKLLVRLNRELGEQKIDVVVNNFSLDKDIFTIARSTGVWL
ncbi:MAG: nucleotidyltransferase domain-containing protein [Ignavibacteriaceae bacterium]|nr:nucleotidyltransferase domain-containing protein [Ignavibacteriaceae bacterium]